MDFDLSLEQKLFSDSVAQFARRHLAAGAAARARDPGFPFDVARLMSAQGVLGITIPEALGGQGGTLMDAVLAIEAVAAVCPRSADVVQAGNFGPIRTFAEYANDRLRARVLPRLLSGEAAIGLGMSEPDAGSAVTELATTAKKTQGGFRVSGSKVFMTHSLDAAFLLVYARFGPGVDGIGALLIDAGAQGVSFGEPVRYMSGEQWRQVYLDDCFVPDSDIVVGAGGFKRLITGFNAERIGNAARSLALGRHAFVLARDYALARMQFGRRIAEFQGIQWKFADMEASLRAAQLLLYKAAVAADRGLPDAQDTAIAKYLCNRAGFEVANEAMQVAGGAGFSEMSLIDYCMRRTRGWMIAGGSLEMMRNRIAEGVFGVRFAQRRRE